MKNRIHKETSRTTLIDFVTLLLVWRTNYCLSTLVNDRFFSATIFIALFGVWFILANNKADYLYRGVLKNGALIIFIIINALIDLGFTGSLAQETINFIIVLIMICVCEYYHLTANKECFMKLVVVILFLDILVKIIYSLQMIAINPAIIKQMSTAGASKNSMVSMLIADYSDVYTYVILDTFLIGIIGKVKQKPFKIFLIIQICLMSYFIFTCSFFFALILLAYGVFCTFFAKKTSTYIIIPLVFLVLTLLFKSYISDFCIYMSNQDYWSEVIQGKWADMSIFLSYGGDAAYMTGMRLDLMNDSLQTFIEYPFLGIQSLPVQDGFVGKHSGWMDGLASYGVLRYIFFVAFLVHFFKMLYHRAPYKSPVLSSISIYCLLSCVNPNIFPQVWVALMVIIPFINRLITYRGVVEKVNEQKEKLI